MWKPRRLITLSAFNACYRDSFTFFLIGELSLHMIHISSCPLHPRSLVFSFCLLSTTGATCVQGLLRSCTVSGKPSLKTLCVPSPREGSQFLQTTRRPRVSDMWRRGITKNISAPLLPCRPPSSDVLYRTKGIECVSLNRSFKEVFHRTYNRKYIRPALQN
jgi:hypothetical protein